MTQLTHELDASHQNGLEHFVTVPKGEALKLRENGAVDVVPDLLRTRLDVDLEREYEGMKGGVYVGGVEAYNEFVEGCVDVVVEGRESGFEGGEEGGEEGGVVAEGVLAAIATGVGLRR